MLFRESETIELKEVVVDEIKKEIIAFANCLNFLSFLTLNANAVITCPHLDHHNTRVLCERFPSYIQII